MKYFFVLFVSLSIIGGSSIAEEASLKKNCHCKECSCTPESHCGCYSETGCSAHCTCGNNKKT